MAQPKGAAIPTQSDSAVALPCYLLPFSETVNTLKIRNLLETGSLLEIALPTSPRLSLYSVRSWQGLRVSGMLVFRQRGEQKDS